MSLLERARGKGPLRMWLMTRKPIFGGFFGGGGSLAAALPPGITEEQAIEVVRDVWGKKLAAGIADRAGLTGKAREDFVESWSRVVAEGLIRRG